MWARASRSISAQVRLRIGSSMCRSPSPSVYGSGGRNLPPKSFLVFYCIIKGKARKVCRQNDFPIHGDLPRRGVPSSCRSQRVERIFHSALRSGPPSDGSRTSPASPPRSPPAATRSAGRSSAGAGRPMGLTSWLLSSRRQALVLVHQFHFPIGEHCLHARDGLRCQDLHSGLPLRHVRTGAWPPRPRRPACRRPPPP